MIPQTNYQAFLMPASLYSKGQCRVAQETTANEPSTTAAPRCPVRAMGVTTRTGRRLLTAPVLRGQVHFHKRRRARDREAKPQGHRGRRRGNPPIRSSSRCRTSRPGASLALGMFR